MMIDWFNLLLTSLTVNLVPALLILVIGILIIRIVNKIVKSVEKRKAYFELVEG